jgi:hypothetical protein
MARKAELSSPASRRQRSVRLGSDIPTIRHVSCLFPLPMVSGETGLTSRFFYHSHRMQVARAGPSTLPQRHDLGPGSHAARTRCAYGRHNHSLSHTRESELWKPKFRYGISRSGLRHRESRFGYAVWQPMMQVPQSRVVIPTFSEFQLSTTVRIINFVQNDFPYKLGS